MLILGIVLVILGIIGLIFAFYSVGDFSPVGGDVSWVIIVIGTMVIINYISDSQNMKALDEKYPEYKKDEFYKVYLEGNNSEYIANPVMSDGKIITNSKIYIKYDGYKKLSREEASGHY